jgi:hypothetical protein
MPVINIRGRRLAVADRDSLSLCTLWRSENTQDRWEWALNQMGV